MAEKKLELDLDEMMKAGVHLGHCTSKLHPKMESFVLGIRNTVHIIDLQKTAEHLEKIRLAKMNNLLSGAGMEDIDD